MMLKEMMMHDPPHPGELLKEDYIEPLIENNPGMSITQIANDLGIDRKTLSNVMNLHAGISTEMALRLEKAFSNTTAGYWINLQKMYDLWQAKQETDIEDVVSYPPKMFRAHEEAKI